jgi:hypothetical protein
MIGLRLQKVLSSVFVMLFCFCDHPLIESVVQYCDELKVETSDFDYTLPDSFVKEPFSISNNSDVRIYLHRCNYEIAVMIQRFEDNE